MRRRRTRRSKGIETPPFQHPAVKAVFDAYPPARSRDLLALRSLIFDTARQVEAVGRLVETLKWGQPAFLPATPRTGSTVRIDVFKKEPDRYGMFVHCQTTLIDDFRQMYGDRFEFQGNRALVFSHGDPLPHHALRHCIARALTYHLKPGRR